MRLKVSSKRANLKRAQIVTGSPSSRTTVQVYAFNQPQVAAAPYLGLTKLAPFGDLINPKSG